MHWHTGVIGFTYVCYTVLLQTVCLFRVYGVKDKGIGIDRPSPTF